jgi:hypothetical protein
MKTLLQKISYGFLAFVAFFGASTLETFANGAIFNNHSNDFPTIQVSNYTQNPSSTTSWGQSVTANPGDLVAVMVYYHNNGTQAANSTKLKINNAQFVQASQTHSISGSVGASNASTVFGSATVNLTSSQTLEFVSASPLWYPNNQIQTTSPFPFGQNGSEVFTTSGLNIGTINTGWPSQGSVVFHYRVGETVQQQPPVVTTQSHSFISNTQVVLNGSVNGQGQNPYTWFVYGTSSNLGSGSFTTSQTYQSSQITSFSETVSVNEGTTYYYKACALTNDGGTVCGSTLSFTTQNTYQPPQIIAPSIFTNAPTSISTNSAVLNGSVGSLGNASSVYSLIFKYGTNSNNLSMTTTATPSSVTSTTSFNRQLTNLSSNTTYYYQACGTNSAGQSCGSIQQFTTGQVYQEPQIIAPSIFTNAPTSISTNSAVLNGSVGSLGNASSVYSLIFKYGTNSNNLSMTTTATPSSVTSTTSFNRQLTNLSSNTTYYYQACGTNSAGQSCGSIQQFTTGQVYQELEINLSVSTLTPQNVGLYEANLRGSIQSTSGQTVHRYFRYGTNSNNLSMTLWVSGSTSNTGNFSRVLYGLNPGTTYHYQACIETTGNPFASTCGNIRTFQTNELEITPTPTPHTGNLLAITSFATSITSNSAVLNGASVNTTTQGTVSYFEYGTTQNLGLTTASQNVQSGQTLYNAQTITGLAPNTTYYYRIVTGNVQGQVRVFTTKANQVVIVPSYPTPTPTPKPQKPEPKEDPCQTGCGVVFLALDITPDFESVFVNDSINFTVDYRNLHNDVLENVVIQVMFPEEIAFRNATRGFYSNVDNVLIVDLGTLQANEKGSFVVRTDVLGRFNNQDLVVTVAEGTFKHPKIEKAQGSSTAYALNTILLERSNLGAFAWGAGFFPGLFGFLILILLILLIILVTRRIYLDHEERKNKKSTLNIH